MVKINIHEYIGMTVLEMVGIETVKKEYGGLFSVSFMVSINKKLISENDYGSLIIKEQDVVHLIPLYAGG